ncbi:MULTISPECIES: MarR family winged helix-turn-helix transcriptional regulator [Mycobacterium]|jgi:DNA-binding MarR family transcriptional regulator|uniref:MarR family winged helix-turn-helix transcriptional regulator n=1 Tax=Mycobacterium TaxID=1763 RepID=UPI001CD91BD6|nr:MULTISPECIES: MarR family transcriptional regulator [Mycobacterium]MDM3895457.1 MarR family transcriptional regulator [Mycobacterium intracellulare]WSE46287.1 MarR family transcriptional regulator [Mycobacterium sp. 3-98]WSE50831.1 MarR family transcriptional regulator [Mycobacterium sp. 2-64]
MSERSGKSSAVDAAKIWSLNYRVLLSVISCAEADICALGLESKELFLLAEIDEHPYPAELAATLSMPKATVTLYLKRLEAAGFVRREIDPSDLRRHRLQLTTTGRRAARDGLKLLSDEFDKRLGRLTVAQRNDLRSLLEKIL